MVRLAFTFALPRWRRWRWRWWSSQCLPSFVQPPARVAEDRCPKFLSCLLKKEAYTTSSQSKTVTDPLVLFRRTSLLESLKSQVQPSEWQFPLDNYCLSSKQAFFVGSRPKLLHIWACRAVTEQPVTDVLSKMEIGICMYRGAVIEAQKATTVVMWIDGGIGISDITCLNIHVLFLIPPIHSCIACRYQMAMSQCLHGTWWSLDVRVP